MVGCGVSKAIWVMRLLVARLGEGFSSSSPVWPGQSSDASVYQRSNWFGREKKCTIE